MKDGAEGHEIRSAEFARIFLPTISYPSENIEIVAEAIPCTKLPQSPKTLIQEILCDADVYNFGGPEFFIEGEKVRQELGINDMREWHESTLRLLKDHKYHTKIARELRNPGKQRNIEKLEIMLG